MFKTRLYLFLAALVVTLLFIPASAYAAQTLDESSSGKVVVLVEGQSLELSLPGNPSTGFSWQYFPEMNNNILNETKHEFRGESNLPGAGGREYWAFQTAGTGAVTLSLAYMRPWESRMPEQTFKLEILVTPQVRVLLDGKDLVFDVPPVIEEGRTLVPLRALFEALGAAVIWNPETRQVTAHKDDITVELTVGSKKAFWRGSKDGHEVTLEVPAQIIGDRVLVPLRFVSEALGGRVDWDEATRTVRISQARPDQAELMNQYQTLVTENQPPSSILEFMDKNKQALSREDMDKAVTGLVDVQQRRLKDYEDKIFSPDINIKLNSYKYEDLKQLDNVKEDNLKNLLKEAFGDGYKLSTSEGMHYLEIDYDQIFKLYSSYISEQVKLYLEIMAAESNKHFAADASLTIGLDELAGRIIKTEQFISNYPNFTRVNEIKRMHGYYLIAYLLGLNNSPAFDYETLKLKDSFQKSYDNTVSSYQNTKLAGTLEEYLALLKKSGLLRTDEIIKFANSAAGF